MVSRRPCLVLLFVLLSPALAAVAAGPALAGEGGEIIRLTPEQQTEALASAREPADNALAPGGGDRRMHGEVGAMIGTGGARAVFGTAAVPLGDHGGVLLSFERSRFGTIR
jgi:hypothetical protein